MADRPVKVEVQRRSFLAAYALTGSTREAASIASVSHTTITRWIRDGEESFLEQVNQAKEEFIQIMELEAYRRATEGQKSLVIYHGEPVFIWKNAKGEIVPQNSEEAVTSEPLYEYKKSDALLMFLLKAARPDRYRENTSIDLTSNGKPVKHFIGVNTDEV